MKERPILFSAPMIRAILAGAKSQTRRVIKPQPPAGCEYTGCDSGAFALCFAEGTSTGASPVCVPPTPTSRTHQLPCPYGAPGDRLWVRETHSFLDGDFRPTKQVELARERGHVTYQADHTVDPKHGDGPDRIVWRPSIFMPRWASRITLEITDVRVERLKSISREDAIAEGARYYDFGHHDGYPNRKRDGWSMRDVTSHDQVLGTAVAAFANEWNRIADGENWNLKDGPSAFDRDPWVWVLAFKRVTP